MLKQPLETAITLHTEDFDDFHMQENMHIVINVKDFKAIVTHAETLHGTIAAHFSYPTRPLQFSYQSNGMHCDFTLMTTGDYRGASSTPKPNFISNRSSSRAPSAVPVQHLSRSASEMPPPPRPNIDKPLSSQSQRKPLRPPSHQASVTDSDAGHEDGLFMPGGGDDQTWDPPNYENEEEEEMLGWDAGNDMQQSAPHPTFRDTGTQRDELPGKQKQPAYESQEGLEPTQRLSQVGAVTFCRIG